MFSLIGFVLRKSLLLVLLGLAIGGPYAYFNGDWKAKLASVNEWFKSTEKKSHGSENVRALLKDLAPPDAAASAGGPAALVAQPPAPLPQPTLVGPEVRQLNDVLRFDMSEAAIMANWSRVTTVRECGLHGLRVPLLTGMQIDDLAGSMTYYFDKNSVMQRIVFRGKTGDDRKLASLVQSVYGLKREPRTGSGLYVRRWNGKPTSVLRVETSSVIRSASPHTRLSIYLELNRPRSYLQVSREMQAWIARERAADTTWRW